MEDATKIPIYKRQHDQFTKTYSPIPASPTRLRDQDMDVDAPGVKSWTTGAHPAVLSSLPDLDTLKTLP